MGPALQGYSLYERRAGQNPAPTHLWGCFTKLGRADRGVCPYGALHGVLWVVDVKKLGGFLVIFNHLKILLLFCNFCVAFLIDLCYTKLR